MNEYEYECIFMSVLIVWGEVRFYCILKSLFMHFIVTLLAAFWIQFLNKLELSWTTQFPMIWDELEDNSSCL